LFIYVNPLNALTEGNPGGKKTTLPGNNKSSQELELSYAIEPFYDVDAFRLIVVVEFAGDKSGETKINLPNNFGSKIDINGIKFLKPLSPNTYLQDTDRPESKIVKHPASSPVRLYYQIEQVRRGDIELGNHYMATINKQYFHFPGETFFIVPAWDEKTEINLRIVWNHMPSNWKLANSFGVNEKYQEQKMQLWKLKYSIFTGGDFRIIKRMVGNNPVFTAIRGKWKFTDDQFSDLLATVLKTERDFWNDHSFPFFLTTVIPISGGGDQGGTGRSNSFALFLSDDRTIDFRFKRLIAHETFHTWIGEKMMFAEPEQLVYWFKEGFTDYYAQILLLRSKLISLEEYVEQYNVILETYFTSPVRYEKNERLINEFWTDKDLMKLPYQRGQIFAHNLNYLILKNSSWKKSLDDFMRDLLLRCSEEALIVSNGSLSALIRFYAGEQILSDIMRTLNSGTAFKTIPEALGPCFKMDVTTKKKLILFGEQYEIPSYKLKNENQQYDKTCLEWFGIY